ncbi:uncharacterized protein LOC113234351, partial [Hyposmocoma kahamanoa]|uniref:uncharacterized protein LOC113234351 n=1 Tax=Hyposmocoma kahamanoa TaxID=1477025 RepID=UPI000E6D7A88
MESLFQRQEILSETINKIGVNFNKDAAARKTTDYIKKRVDTIDELWNEFENNHSRLLYYDIKTTMYVNTNMYEKVKSKYESIRNTLLTYQAPPDGREAKGTPSKSDELIMQQATNFRALSRLIRNIDIETINEKWEVEDKLQMLQARWKIIDETHWQIDNLLTDCNLDYEQDFTDNENRYESIKRQLHRKLNATTSQNQSLPKIEIPIFSGNYAQWPTFLDLYRETIHNNMSLSKAQKMQHLKGRLRGEAERIVQHLTVSAENYDACWDILTHRYDNKQLLFTRLMQTFMNQPSIQHQSAYELKRLHDTTLETTHAINNLGVDTATWAPILVHILTGKLDADTYTSYMETRKAPRELPTFDEFIQFLESKFTALEPVTRKKQQPNVSTAPKPYNPPERNPPARAYSTPSLRAVQNKQTRVHPRTYHVSAERSCPLCKTNHVLMNCKLFSDMAPDAKLKTISQLNICENCLYCHDKQCHSKKTCRVCNLPHHTSLHDTLRVAKRTPPPPEGQPPLQPKFNHAVPLQTSSNHVAGNYNEVLLATLQIRVKAINGTYVTLRCLLDQRSQINLITESAVQRLGLPRQHENASVFGIGASNTQSNGTVSLNCTSLYGDYTFTTSALVMKKVLNNLPNCSFKKQQWPHLQDINLADPDYNVSRPVDVLLDAGVYAEIATGCILRGPSEAPIALQTKVGWVLLGNMKTYNCHALIHNLEEISQFWELEDITTNNNKQMTSGEACCETLYANSTRRLADGRYVVKIPMKQNYEQKLGTSKRQAVAQFRQLEKRLTQNEELSDSYKAFIGEYVALGHMKLSTESREPSCFLPHHGVLKPESTTTKLRAVFNASSNTSSGYSLNQLMECGPNLQQDLQSMILRWRSYQYVYTADIEKFYRQILIAEEDQHLQKIVWRDSTLEPIQEYQLCTVTYGTKAAPFLAMRTIKQLIMDEGKFYPLAAEILDHQLYVDDLLAGCNSIEEAQMAQSQLITMLKCGGFNMRKWASNNLTLLENLPEELISQNMFNFQQAETNKTLGITWNPQTDNFTFRHNSVTTTNDVTTKRTLLSELAKLYDPLGWLSPVTTKAKLMFQQAWKTTSDWDSPLPECIQQEWEQFNKELPSIQNFFIPRWIGNTQQNIELHGFSDASEKAYGCVIYCISTGPHGKKVIQIVAGKTKLAPLNKRITLPRMELCGALSLAHLMKKVTDSIKAQTVTIHGWTDSMVVLGWLQGEPYRWKTFVANRVTQITEVMPPNCWRHVKSEDNPADCASRGLSPCQLLSHSLWLEGPSWLKSNDLPPENIFETREEERKQPQVCVTQIPAPLIEELLHKHSSMTRATRTLSWILRFIKNARDKNGAIRLTYLSSTELRSTLHMIIKTVQHNSFAEEISQLQKHNRVSSSSKIINLNPIIDRDTILRVGGRLGRADLSHTQKHPIILPKKYKLTELLIEQAHAATLHGGARLTLQYLRTKYWIIGGMSTVKHCITRCVKCHRHNKQNSYQLMADLPEQRVNPSRPFTHTGVDFTGQVDVKANKGRGIKTMKAYIAVFICLCTKAVHLELVSDLTAAAFIAALKRLCGRRGTPRHMYSDNGTNFVSAAKILTKEREEALRLYVNDEFLNFAAESNIEWHFNAPSWPTAGGLWEAAVKSLKHHLRRVLGEQRLTFEEFSTLLVQIEACLNSRPLVAITEDPEDLECLTPGHFLVGGPLLGPPLSTDDNNMSLTIRWRQTEKMLSDFWKRWSTTYLQTLQTRSKWFYPTPNLQIDDLVLLRDDHIPPARWLMGRITDTHAGADGRVRVVTLKTKTSDNVKRPITKLSRLPISHAPDEADNS